MGLDLRWIASDGSTLDELLDPKGLLDLALDRNGPDTFPLLAALDPYADADVSPSRQLSAELRRLRDKEPDPEVSSHLNRMLSIAEGAESIRGSYLRFVGD